MRQRAPTAPAERLDIEHADADREIDAAKAAVEYSRRLLRVLQHSRVELDYQTVATREAIAASLAVIRRREPELSE